MARCGLVVLQTSCNAGWGLCGTDPGVPTRIFLRSTPDSAAAELFASYTGAAAMSYPEAVLYCRCARVHGHPAQVHVHPGMSSLALAAQLSVPRAQCYRTLKSASTDLFPLLIGPARALPPTSSSSRFLGLNWTHGSLMDLVAFEASPETRPEADADFKRTCTPYCIPVGRASISSFARDSHALVAVTK